MWIIYSIRVRVRDCIVCDVSDYVGGRIVFGIKCVSCVILKEGIVEWVVKWGVNGVKCSINIGVIIIINVIGRVVKYVRIVYSGIIIKIGGDWIV